MAKANSTSVLVGMILIALGILLLLNNLGYLTHIDWQYLLQLWPLVLVFAGLNILFKDTKLWWLAPLLLIVLLIGLLFYGDELFRIYHRPGYPFPDRFFDYW